MGFRLNTIQIIDVIIVVPHANMMYNHHGGLDARRSMFMPKRPWMFGLVDEKVLVLGRVTYRYE